jgi:nucleotide-binding universal stress UspA family protein
MKNIRKILFPTDFSETAQNAFRYALFFAEKVEARIHVLHVVMPEYESLDLPIMAMQATQQKIEVAKDVMKAFTDSGVGLLTSSGMLSQVPELSTSIEVGGIADTITTVVKRDDIDLIVMGTRHEHSRFERMFGSVASSIVANAPCGVMVVPEEAALHELHKVAYASDLHVTDPYNIWKVAQVLEPFSPVLHCIHVNDGHQENGIRMSELQEFFKNNAPALQINFKEINGNSVADVLGDFIETFDIDLLVMASPQRSLIERVFHQSMTRHMALFANVPLLVCRE